jgi:hypothetical protein
MKNLLTLLFCAFTIVASGQITCTNYLLEYNEDTNQYDVSLVILKGSTNTVMQRCQFSTQITLVIPHGESITFTDLHMPLQNNQSYDSTTPTTWREFDILKSPESSPSFDFYGIIPHLSPSSFYNNLNEGDVVHLFSFTVGQTGAINEDVRLFENGSDPSSFDPGMGGGNFSTTFRIGNSPNIYNPSSEISCITSTDEINSFNSIVYPNPFQNKLTIELPSDTKNVQVIGVHGELYDAFNNPLNELLVISTTQYPKGFYIIRYESNTGTITSKKIVKY